MNISISPNASELGKAAARLAAVRISEAIARRNEARIIVSTGSSHFEFYQVLVKEKVDWKKVEAFHLDEYIGLPVTHKASFRKFLHERFISLVPVRKFYPVEVEGKIGDRLWELSAVLRKEPVDLGIIGIGVNGHIAFNDPPADFNSRESYIIVKLNEACKMQQVNEGWFKSIEEVPDEAVSMTVWQIMQCSTIISVVPHLVKADAVKNTLSRRLTNTVPATMLKKHPDWHLFLDNNSASEIITL